MNKVRFIFEDLEVWQKSVRFANRIIKLSENLPSVKKHYRLVDQLEASATSICMNIAEGRGRQSKKEFAQFLHIAKGSLFETLTLLTIFHQNSWIGDKEFEELRVSADEIGRMISGLISFARGSQEPVVRRSFPKP